MAVFIVAKVVIAAFFLVDSERTPNKQARDQARGTRGEEKTAVGHHCQWFFLSLYSTVQNRWVVVEGQTTEYGEIKYFVIGSEKSTSRPWIYMQRQNQAKKEHHEERLRIRRFSKESIHSQDYLCSVALPSPTITSHSQWGCCKAKLQRATSCFPAESPNLVSK
jgi:protease II